VPPVPDVVVDELIEELAEEVVEEVADEVVDDLVGVVEVVNKIPAATAAMIMITAIITTAATVDIDTF